MGYLICVFFWMIAMYVFGGVGLNTIWMVSRWAPKDQIKRYFVIRNPRLARLLVRKYEGSNQTFRTNIPLFFNTYEVNPIPNRISLLGVIASCVMLPLTAWYAVEATRYFFFYFPYARKGTTVLPALAAVIIGNLVFYALGMWNRRKTPSGEIISRGERKKRVRTEKRGGKQ